MPEDVSKQSNKYKYKDILRYININTFYKYK